MTEPTKPTEPIEPQDHDNSHEAETVPTELTAESPPASASASPAPAPPVIVAPVAASARSGILRWLVPALPLVAVATIALLGGILIGQHTGGPERPADFIRSGSQSQDGQGPRGERGQQDRPGQRIKAARPGASGDLTAGTIQSIDGGTIIVKLPDGSTATVKTTDSTNVTKAAASSVSDLKAGETLMVRGPKDGSGNVSATSISEGPNGFFGARPGANE